MLWNEISASRAGTKGAWDLSPRRRRMMYWYNPKTRTMEERPTPSTDTEVEEILGGHLNSDTFLREYLRWRASGKDIEQAMIFTGKAIRDLHMRNQPPG
jgi:hypothetical protein